ncbi:thioredoxin family protein [Patescibacteria group bacterium]|nr:thioredoxin family protein [Patescibacteria group bacterium]
MKVLKFGAVWCPGCLVMKPIWAEIEAEMTNLETEYYDFDNDKEMIEKYHIDHILPVFVFLDNGDNEILRLTGEVDKDKLIDVINENIDK